MNLENKSSVYITNKVKKARNTKAQTLSLLIKKMGATTSQYRKYWIEGMIEIN